MNQCPATSSPSSGSESEPTLSASSESETEPTPSSSTGNQDTSPPQVTVSPTTKALCVAHPVPLLKDITNVRKQHATLICTQLFNDREAEKKKKEELSLGN